MKNRDGFTLLELLLVITIIGIIASAVWLNLWRSIRSAEVHDSANQIVADLRRARSQSQRGSVDSSIILPGTSGGQAYTFGGVSKSLPNNISVLCKTNCGSLPTVTVNYSSPYGELNDVGKIFVVKSGYAGIRSFEIRIFGITGKAILTQVSS